MAARMMGVSQTGLYNALSGNAQTCAGYHWEYADGQGAKKPNKPRSRPTMTITEVQEEAARRTRETGRYVRYKHIQIEETLALIRQREGLDKLKKEAK
jgi:hypothetical protein